jgi:Tfp pilus assembly protein PilF
MTGKRGGEGPAARKLILCVLLSSVLFMFWSCAEIGPKPNPVHSDKTLTPDPSEAQLLAEVDKKWENPQAHYQLARIYHKAQNWIQADWRYSTALGQDPAHKGAQAGQVKLFIDRGDAAKAEQFAGGYIRQAASLVKEMLKLGWEFRQVNLDEYALRCFRQALDADPSSSEANKQIGFYYYDKKDTAKAKQYLLQSFQLNPRQPEVAGALGKLGIIVQLPPEPPEQAPAKPK